MANFPGTAGNDIYPGTTADDTITGLGGDDELRGDAGNDSIDGGDGNDKLYGDAGSDNITGGVGNDLIQGGYGQDTLDGGAGFDRLEGENGDDTIDGGFGDDNLIGDDGNDRLTGGAGNNQLFGGTGNDNFYFGGAAISATNNITSSLGNDTITDFTPGQDKIVLSLAAFTNMTSGGGLSFASVANDDAAALSSAKIVYNQTSHLLSYKNPAVGAPLTEIGSGGAFATLNISAIGFNLTAGDFTLVA